MQYSYRYSSSSAQVWQTSGAQVFDEKIILFDSGHALGRGNVMTPELPGIASCREPWQKPR